MKKLIDQIGPTAFYILLGLLVIIVIILVVIIITDSIKNRKEQELEKDDIKEEHKEQETITEQEKAKQELERLTEELQKEKDDIMGPTKFELEQESSSIISYEELLNASAKIDIKNTALLEDEGNEPISLDDLYKKEHKEISPIVNEILNNEHNAEEPIAKEIPLENSKKIELMDFNKKDFDATSKFKTSNVISPVYGIVSENTMTSITKNPNDTEETITKEQLDFEIRKTEEFLEKLKELKNKLD